MGNLNVVVTKQDIEQVVSRAALAAATAEGQSNVAKIGNEALGCIKIVATADAVTFESSVSRFAAKLVVKVGNGVEVREEGEACIPLKDFKQIMGKIPGDYRVSLVFVPRAANQVSEMPADMRNVFPVGTIEMGAVGPKRTVVKATTDSFPTSNFNAQQFPDIADLDVVFVGKAEVLRKAYADISFSTNKDCPNNVFDKLGFNTAKDALFLIAADGRRCAIVEAKADRFEKYAAVEPQLPLLIDVEFLTPILSSLSDDDPMTLAVSRDRGHAYILSDNTSYRMAMTGQETRMKYPNYRKAIELKSEATVLVDRKEMLLALNVLKEISPDRGEHVYGDDGEIAVTSQSIMALKKAQGSAPFEWVGDKRLQRRKLHFCTDYLIGGLSRMSCDKVRLSFTPNETRVRVEDETNPTFLYYVQVIPPQANLPQAEDKK